MFIKSSPGQLVLLDAQNFGELKLVRAPGAILDGAVERQLGRIEGDHIWVNDQWFLAQPPAMDATWRQAFEAMKNYARSKGWVDGSGAVRVHIEEDGGEGYGR